MKAEARGTVALTTYTLWRRELVRFVRDRNRVTGSVLQPALLWILMGSGLGASFQPAGTPDGTSFLEYIFPGTMLLILLFTAIFSTISVVEDRREGFMQSVMAAPVPTTGVVLGKVLGGTTLALAEVAVFAFLAPLVGIPISVGSLSASAGVLLLVALGFTGLGFRLAWSMESTAGFHAIMNVLLLPMWLLSGAFFPLTGVPTWLEWVMRVNPVSYGMAALRQTLYLDDPARAASGSMPDFAVCVGVTAAFAALMLGLSIRAVQRRNGATT